MSGLGRKAKAAPPALMEEEGPTIDDDVDALRQEVRRLLARVHTLTGVPMRHRRAMALEQCAIDLAAALRSLRAALYAGGPPCCSAGPCAVHG